MSLVGVDLGKRLISFASDLVGAYLCLPSCSQPWVSVAAGAHVVNGDFSVLR